MSFRGFVWLLLALVPVYVVLALVVPPADDEFYYWCWSEQLQLSYYDHPPMVAYMIRAGTFLLGDTLLAIRLPAILSTLTVLAVIGWLTRPRDLLPLVVFTPLFTFGAVLVTPDTPLLMFWALYVLWLVKMHEGMAAESGSSSRFGLWALGGVVLGCGILGKYTTGLAVLAGFLSFVFAGNWRKWIVGYTLHLAVAFVVTLPILIHNIRHDFIPLQYQWKHSMSSPQPGLMPFASFVGIQVLFFGVLPFAVFVWSLLHRRELLAVPRLRVCLCLFAFPFAFFLYKATRGHLEGNWALACYIAVWPLAAEWFERVKQAALSRRLVYGSFAVPAGCVLLIGVHLVHPIGWLKPEQDRIMRQVSKEEMASQLRASLQELQAGEPVYVASYQWAALLQFHQIDARQIDGMTRPSHFTQHPERPADRDHVYVFAEGFLPPNYVTEFGPPRIVQKFPLVVRGREVGVYWLLEYAKPAAATGHAALSAP